MLVSTRRMTGLGRCSAVANKKGAPATIDGAPIRQALLGNSIQAFPLSETMQVQAANYIRGVLSLLDHVTHLRRVE